VTTTFGLAASSSNRSLLIGAVAAVVLAWAVWRSTRPGDPTPARIAAIGAAVLFLLRAVDGLGFVPGFLTTVPFAVVALVLWNDPRLLRPGRDAVLMAVAALPLVWLFQYSGGAVPQWGGRYVLTTGLVLGAVGVALSPALDRVVRGIVIGLSVGVAVFGLAWMSYRTHEIGRAAETVAAIDEPVVSTENFWLRELGSEYRGDSEWLSLGGESELPDAVAVLDAADRDSFVLLWRPGSDDEPPAIEGWSAGEPTAEDWLDVEFWLVPYTRS
jgi:hypothetical protein